MWLDTEREPPRPSAAGAFYLGLDLGQASDYTALAVIDKTPDDEGGDLYAVRHLERWRGVRYPVLVGRMGALYAALGTREPRLVVDYTGVGRPVVDQLVEANLRPIPVTITGGTRMTQEPDGSYRVPKRDLVGAAQVLLQAGRLKIAADLELADVLVKELLTFKVKITESAHDTYGAWREGEHDDLVLAVALAAWYARTVGGMTAWFV